MSDVLRERRGATLGAGGETPARTGERRAPQRLSAAHERRLVLAAGAGDSLARGRLVESLTPLIGSIARTYRGAQQVEAEELMQAGVVGLLRALERFDPDLGTPFWAYASWWVRQAMQQLVSELGRPVVLSDRAARKLARLRDAEREHIRERTREPGPQELAAMTGLPHSEVECLLAASRRARGLEEPLGSDEPGKTTFGETLADPRAEDAYDGIPRRVLAERLPTMLQALDDRERQIVSGRFGLKGPALPLRELAGRFGVSAERVRQIEEVALQKLREAAY
jgi:RNA polymerase primary sigma factor